MMNERDFSEVPGPQPRRANPLRLFRAFATFAVLLAGAVAVDAQVCTQHEYLGNDPDEGNPGWSEEAQGMTHDTDYWYVSQNAGHAPRLWRIPVTTDLSDHVQCGHDGVSCEDLEDTLLHAAGYDHYGDQDFFEFEGQGYVVMPVDGGPSGSAGVAFFRADETLELVGFAPVPAQPGWGWLAIDPDGILVSAGASGAGSVSEFRRYTVDWARLRDTGEAVITPLDFMVLEDESGQPLEVNRLQGGEFADDDGHLLYFSNGFAEGPEKSWGVHVFRTRPGAGDECRGHGTCVVAHRVERSHNGPGGFAYEFDPTSPVEEEPEGLTFWDLDADGRAPGLRGQLHVMLLDNDATTDDDIYVKHYSRAFGDDVAPEITCPGDASAECSAHGGVPADDAQLASFFTGASATDDCAESIVPSNDAPVLFGLGTTNVEFTAEDDFGNASQCVATVTAVDTTPPVIDCPDPVSAECTSAQGVSSSDPQLVSFFHGASATDVCDASPAVSNDAPAVLAFGDTTVTFTAADASGNPSSCASTIRVGDTTPPALRVSLSRTTIWPPNHRFVPITASVTVTDRCNSSASFQLVSITSNEPGDANGDGATAPDVEGASFGTADTSFALRAERSGTGAGRVYTIMYRASDTAGNVADATATVTVRQ